MSTLRPSVAQIRQVGQPEEIISRVSGEHWAGRLYMRHLSPYLTARLAPTRVTADAVTWAMIACGLLAALVLTLPGWAAALAAVLLVQTQLLLDCSDGELARWRGRTGASGVYLDRIGHWSTEAALATALGIRADGGWDSIGGWTTLGLVIAVLILMIKGETELVHVARHHAGLPLLADTGERTMATGLRRLRGLADIVPFHRALLAIEVTFLALVASVVDAFDGSMRGTHGLIVLLLAIGVVVVIGHLLTIVTSRRLR